MRYSSRQALEGVIEKTARLAGSPLAKLLEDGKDLGVRWQPPEPPVLTGPDQQALDAALRIARQLDERSGPESFEAIAERLSEDADLSDQLGRDLARLVRQLRGALDRPPAMRFKVKGQTPPTHRETLDLFLHRDPDRLDPARRKALSSWIGQPTGILLVRSQLQVALGDLCKAAQQLRSICERELLRAAG